MAAMQICGHRGAAGLRPENTLAGFRYAIELGVDGVECDVHLSRDRRLVVMHDEAVDRTTNGSGLIREMDLADIKRLDAGQGERVPTLDEVLDTVQGKVALLCEIKGEGSAEAAADAVRARGMTDQVTFISFELPWLRRLKYAQPDVRVGALYRRPTEASLVEAFELEPVAIGLYYHRLSLVLVDMIQNAGIAVGAWSPNTLREQQAMLAMGVDAITTDRPDILLGYMGAR